MRLLALALLLGVAAGGCTRTPEATVTNRLGMQMVLIPAGEFTMGNPATVDEMAAHHPALERERLEELGDEKPVHRVRITRPFYMARHEVTVGQFRQFLAESGHVPHSVADRTGAYGYSPTHVRTVNPETGTHSDAFAGRDPRYSWENPGFEQTDAHPVLNVTWYDAEALARWLSATEKRKYRLPTEAEWEYACRAGTSTQFHSGDAPTSLEPVANLFDADSAVNWPLWQAYALPWSDGFAFTAPVGRFAPNAFGLHDMHGNAWEWTSDWYDEAYYARSPTDDPQGPSDGEFKVRRGGSWQSWPIYSRCGYRNWVTPDSRYVLIGMRMVMELGQ